MKNEAIEKKLALRWLIFSTIIYLPIFSFFLLHFINLPKILSSNSVSLYSFWIFHAILFLIPLVLLISIFMMWLHYFEKQYVKSRFYCRLPFLTVIICFFLLCLFGIYLEASMVLSRLRVR